MQTEQVRTPAPSNAKYISVIKSNELDLPPFSAHADHTTVSFLNRSHSLSQLDWRFWPTEVLLADLMRVWRTPETRSRGSGVRPQSFTFLLFLPVQLREPGRCPVGQHTMRALTIVMLPERRQFPSRIFQRREDCTRRVRTASSDGLIS
jgi:hypothetical protein